MIQALNFIGTFTYQMHLVQHAVQLIQSIEQPHKWQEQHSTFQVCPLLSPLEESFQTVESNFLNSDLTDVA